MDKIDNAAHTLAAFKATKAWVEGELEAYYHEDRLYSVRDTKRGIVSLVEAKSPVDAIAKVKRDGDWIRTADRLPDKPTGPEYYSFEGVDIAADEYNVMIEGAELPTSAHWTGSCWFDPYGPIEQLLPVIAWRPLPDPPSWALQDPEHEEGDLPFPEVV